MTYRPALVDDESARRLAQTEFDHPVAVEAGAGTGKTTVLVARILAWCLGHGWSPARDELLADGTQNPSDDEIASHVLDGLLAITFTEAAAAQMTRRVAEALVGLAADPAIEVTGFHKDQLPAVDPLVLEQRARALTGALDHLAIRTIHSHCWHLLATYPMAIGLSPDLQIDADGRQLEELVRELVETATKKAYAGPADHPLHRLAIRGIDPRAVATALVKLISDGFPAAALEGDPLSQKRRSAIRKGLLDTVSVVQGLTAPLTSQTRAKKDLETAAAVEETLAWLNETPTEPDLEGLARLLDQLRETWAEDRLKKLGQWSRGEFTQTATRLVGDGCRQLASAAGKLARQLTLYLHLDVDVLDAARRALQPLIATTEEELRARGVVTYSSLMTEAWKLLREHPPVLSSERRRLRQLLVDEFQDTDRLQCDLVRFLALGGEESARPGLFVVGDPKQSIYGWRDADLEAYENFLEDLQAAGGLCVALNRNFRSVPPVLEEVDRAISPVMSAEPGLQPEFAGLVASDDHASDSGFRKAGRAAVEYWVAWDEAGPRTRADDAARLEADAIAADIRELHDQEGVAWNEFGLLLRSTSRLETYLESFRRARIPFVVTSDKHYFRRREIIEAAALVRTVLVPVDHLGLVTFLRSATVGVPDAALLPLWQNRFPELVTRLSGPESPELEELRRTIRRVATDLPADIPGLDDIRGWESSAIAALENLAYLRQAFDTEPSDRFINQLRERFLFDVTESARHLGIYRLANLDRFFRELERALEEQGGDIQGVLRALRRSVTEAQEAEQALPEGATEEAVQVMTIHGAKGLEFGHVYLPQLHAKGRRNQRPAVEADRRWLPGLEAEYVLFGSPSPGFHRVEERQSEVERTEQVRTLYVAMTRARSRLVLLGNWPAVPGPVAPDKRATYLDLLRSRARLPESLEELHASCSREGGSGADVGGVRWRFLDLGSPAASRHGRKSGVSGLPTLKIVEQQAARLAALRGPAADRMHRRFSGAASAEAAERLARLASDEIPHADLPTARDIALPVGTAFHRMMETWHLTTDPATELARQREIQHRWLRSSVAFEQVPGALDRFDLLLDRFRQGQFMDRFTAMAGNTLAREVSILVPPLDPDSGPVGYITGFIDLLYRHPESGHWIIVDYKTDRVEERADIEERAEAYLLQEAVYSQAIQESLNLEQPPTAQLWFIWPDVLWEDPAAP
jgi:ATP-dependent helicase/nuclease subunit A